MPRGSATQTRSFNYGNPPGAYLLSATNPETGTVSYAYNTDGTLASKGALAYGYDTYKRLVTVSSGGVTLRTYSYDMNPSDGS
ncbi:MAG: hypothetical protein M3Z32_08025 [Acidobacteriota bacterium]|nr:hypothetical protein [Acidobacteriota bacterium]